MGELIFQGIESRTSATDIRDHSQIALPTAPPEGGRTSSDLALLRSKKGEFGAGDNLRSHHCGLLSSQGLGWTHAALPPRLACGMQTLCHEAKHAVRPPGQGSSEQRQKPVVPRARGPARGRAAGQGCRCQDVPSAGAARGQGVGREGRLGPGKVGQEQERSRADVNRPLFRKPRGRRSVVSVRE